MVATESSYRELGSTTLPPGSTMVVWSLRLEADAGCWWPLPPARPERPVAKKAQSGCSAWLLTWTHSCFMTAADRHDSDGCYRTRPQSGLGISSLATHRRRSWLEKPIIGCDSAHHYDESPKFLWFLVNEEEENNPPDSNGSSGYSGKHWNYATSDLFDPAGACRGYLKFVGGKTYERNDQQECQYCHR
jgi:hypothetical protein